jgi:hypothetical protein
MKKLSIYEYFINVGYTLAGRAYLEGMGVF